MPRHIRSHSTFQIMLLSRLRFLIITPIQILTQLRFSMNSWRLALWNHPPWRTGIPQSTLSQAQIINFLFCRFIWILLQGIPISILPQLLNIIRNNTFLNRSFLQLLYIFLHLFISNSIFMTRSSTMGPFILGLLLFFVSFVLLVLLLYAFCIILILIDVSIVFYFFNFY